VSVARAVAVVGVPCEVKVALVAGLARIAAIRDETTEDAKRRACETTSTLDSLNVLQDGSNYFFAIVVVEKVLTALNEV
jgi:hypothetical protein